MLPRLGCSRTHRRGRTPSLTDAELLCLVVVAQQLLGVASDRRWIRYARTDPISVFPYLTGQSGYGRRLRAAGPLIAAVTTELARDTDSWHDPLRLVDSTPLPCAASRETVKRSSMLSGSIQGRTARSGRTSSPRLHGNEDVRMDGGAPGRWSEVAEAWSQLWGDLPRPLWDVVVRDARIGPGHRVLDAGCGSGELLAHLAGTGAEVCGFDPAAGMVAAARRRVPGADVRTADLSAVPWADATFDVVVSVNAVQFADDVDAAGAELVRVCRPGGVVVLAGWAEDARNDLARVESAVAAWHEEDVPPDGPLRLPGGLGSLLRAAGAAVEVEDLVELPWRAGDDAALVRGVLLGEDDDVVQRLTGTVLAAAAPFRGPAGYLLVNAFRYALARRPG